MNNNLNELLEKLNWNTKESFFEEFEKEKYSHVDLFNFLTKVINNELDFLKKRRMEISFKTSGIPFLKRIEDFDFNFQPGINKNQIIKLAELDFLEKNENLIFIGAPGVGKTHLAISIGIRALEKRKSVYFITYSKLIIKLKEAYEKGVIEEKLKHFSKYKLLIIDEMGYIDLPKGVSDLLFRLVEKFYEKKSLIITTNKDYEEWLELFDNPSTGGAVIDRLLHHSKTIIINGRSYRAFEKSKNEL